MKSGFTLVEIMIVVAIIGLLATIAIPNFIRARTVSQQNACISNLRHIDGAIQQWALENKAGADSEVEIPDIQPYFGRGSGQMNAVICPAAGPNVTNFASSYSITKVDEAPTCLIGGNLTVMAHTLR